MSQPNSSSKAFLEVHSPAACRVLYYYYFCKPVLTEDDAL